MTSLRYQQLICCLIHRPQFCVQVNVRLFYALTITYFLQLLIFYFYNFRSVSGTRQLSSDMHFWQQKSSTFEGKASQESYAQTLMGAAVCRLQVRVCRCFRANSRVCQFSSGKWTIASEVPWETIWKDSCCRWEFESQGSRKKKYCRCCCWSPSNCRAQPNSYFRESQQRWMVSTNQNCRPKNNAFNLNGSDCW